MQLCRKFRYCKRCVEVGRWTKGEIDPISLGHIRKNLKELEKKMCHITKNRFSDIERNKRLP